MKNPVLTEETLGYMTAADKANIDPRFLVAPSQNVIVDRQRKASSRRGYTRLGASNSALTAVRNSFTWQTSTGTELALRFYDDELEVYLGTIDGIALNGWYRVRSGWSTTAALRADTWWDTGENLDLLLMVNGDDDHYEWGGGVAVIASVGTNTLTKQGTRTWAQNRAYTAGDKVFINVRTGVEFTYTGGETTTTLTSVTPDPAVADIVVNDVFVQKVVTTSNSPASGRNNHTIHVFENQVLYGSDDDNEVYISSNTSHSTFSTSAPRVAGEGELMTLDGPTRGIGTLGKFFIVFSGESSIFKSQYTEITVGSTLAEVMTVKKLNTGQKYGSLGPDTVVMTGNSIIYLSNEPAVREITDPDELEGSDPRTLSNPIKPDFDDEDFTNSYAIWYKNAYYLASSVNSRLYILEFVEDADGKLRRYWQPPQVLPVRALSVITDLLHGHSNTIPESYRLFAEDTYSDTASSDEKVPINAIAAYAYNTYGRRANQKNFDEYWVEGEISPGTTDLELTLNYNFGGHAQVIVRTIDGSDQDILQETILNASLANQPLGQYPLGGALSAPEDAARFAVNFEIAREDFEMIQAVFSTNEVDRFWSIAAHGPNVKLSRRQNTQIKK